MDRQKNDSTYKYQLYISVDIDELLWKFIHYSDNTCYGKHILENQGLTKDIIMVRSIYPQKKHVFKIILYWKLIFNLLSCRNMTQDNRNLDGQKTSYLWIQAD